MAEASIYLGAWTNWKDGHVAGATLTTTNSAGAFLLTFTTLYVAYAGNSLWKLLSFIIYQCRATDQARDALFHQQQVILRNASSPSASLWLQLQLSWSWKSPRAYRGNFRSIPFAILAFIHIAAWIAAGLLASRISQKRAEVLISGPRCGYRVPSSESVLPALSVAAKIASSNYKAALFRHGFDLAQSCFTNTTSNLPSTFNCDLYPKSSFRTQSSFTRGNHCPFATTDICLDLTKGTFRVDTGPLDSRQHFGINTRHDGDRLTVRKVMDCTPIRTQSYQTSWNYTDSVNSTLDFNYGHPAGHPNDPTTIKLPLMLLWHPQQPYTINITAFYPWNPQDSDFEPIPELHRDDADVNLILLQNHAKFLAEVDDPWFNASHVVGDPRAGGYYEYLDPVHVLGCTEQYEFCDPKSLTCTGLMSIGNVLDDQTISQFGFNPHQKTLAKHIGKLLSLFTLKALWTNLPSSYLLASTEVDPVSAYSSRLPSDQWTQEVKNWLRMMQIALQRSVIDYAAGPVNIGGDHFLSEPQMAFERDLCLSQIIHNSTYSSFSILGMVIIFVIGGLFIILDQLAPSLQKRLFRHRDPAVQDLWLFDDYLHLQQRAFEEAGVGKWYHRANSVPITYRPENFKPLRNARKTVVKLEVENMPSVAVFSPHIYDFAYLSNRINSRV